MLSFPTAVYISRLFDKGTKNGIMEIGETTLVSDFKDYLSFINNRNEVVEFVKEESLCE